jgi:hypothetical protein
MKRWLRYLGFLGFLGLIGLFTGHPGYCSLFNLFGLWSLSSKQKNDELLALNTAKAGRNAFIITMITMSLTIAFISIVKTLFAAEIAIAVAFTAQLLTFIISLNIYEKRGNN